MKTRKTNDSDKTQKQAADVAGRIKDKPSFERTEVDVRTDYGFGQNAGVDTQGEVTERQEYTAEGLPKTQQYSVDKVGRPHVYGKGGERHDPARRDRP